MTLPTFSIVIPTFNSEKTVSKVLDSILSQTFSGYEIVLVDGVSADKTGSIIKEYQKYNKNIYWTSEKDNGIYDAMNKGVMKATGEWILFLGSDDSLYNPGILQQIAQVAAANPDVSMLYGNVLLNKGMGFEYESLVYAGEFHSSRLLYANICHQAIFYKRSLFEQFGGFNTRYKLLADWDFNLRCFNRSKPLYLDVIVSNFFVGASSSNNTDEDFKKDFISNVVNLYPYSKRDRYFKYNKKKLSTLLLNEIASFRVKKAFKVSQVLYYILANKSV